MQALCGACMTAWGARRGKARRVMSAGCGAAHAMVERPRNTDPGYGVVACQVMP
jgi:hypothetical protein